MAASIRAVVDFPFVPVMSAVGIPWSASRRSSLVGGPRAHPRSGFRTRAHRGLVVVPEIACLWRQRRLRARGAPGSSRRPRSPARLCACASPTPSSAASGSPPRSSTACATAVSLISVRGVERVQRRRKRQRGAAGVEPHGRLGLAPAGLAVAPQEPLPPRLRQRLGVVVVYGDFRDGAGAVEEEAGAGEAAGVG